ncbi:GlsB/YeaQ/YmgE family stress response membrane protein [Actinoplanes sp. NPDC051494]|uniref:GlsB/YeaQ/YmgE family stress response membrane protein n=1 Tax=Actinoplanes sp. NPDC051494 TaxID=3363907 RepID=UPI00378CFBF5
MLLVTLLKILAIGLTVGAAGHLFVARHQQVPWWSTALFGIGAAFLGTVVASALGVPDDHPFHGVRVALQAVCAVLGVALAILLSRRGGRARPGGLRGRPGRRAGRAPR